MTVRPNIWQVLDDLRADRTAEWQLVDHGLIRYETDEGWHCPLSWLAQTKPCLVDDAAQKLGLPLHDALAISYAADNDSIDEPFRLALLRACRLDPAGEGQ